MMFGVTRQLIVGPLLMLAMLLMLGACGTPPTPTPTPNATVIAEEVAQTVQDLQLIGTSWQAESFGGPALEDKVPVIPDSRLTVNFGIDRYAGTGGCNWFLGVYEVEGESMRFQTPATTAAICEPEAVMVQEGTYLSSLWNIISYREDGDKLLGYTSEDQLLVTFVPAEPVEFEGTAWEMRFQDYGNGLTPILMGSNITATFASGEITGFAGCNTFQGTYTLEEDGTFSAPELISTRMTCAEPEGVMDQETKFLENVQTATKLVQTGGLVQLHGSDGETLVALGIE